MSGLRSATFPRLYTWQTLTSTLEMDGARTSAMVLTVGFLCGIATYFVFDRVHTEDICEPLVIVRIDGIAWKEGRTARRCVRDDLRSIRTIIPHVLEMVESETGKTQDPQVYGLADVPLIQGRRSMLTLHESLRIYSSISQRPGIYSAHRAGWKRSIPLDKTPSDSLGSCQIW